MPKKSTAPVAAPAPLPPPAAPVAPPPLKSSFLVESHAPPKGPTEDKSGLYRFIHGGMFIINPAWKSDAETPHTPKQIRVGVHPIRTSRGESGVGHDNEIIGYRGDVVWLNSVDAHNCLRAGLVEPADTPLEKSRVGKCLIVPPETKHWWPSYMPNTPPPPARFR